MLRGVVFARLSGACRDSRRVCAMSVSIIGAVFAGKIDMLLDAVISGQCAAALLPLIANKLRGIRRRDAAVEDRDADSVACSTIGNTTTQLPVAVLR